MMPDIVSGCQRKLATIHTASCARCCHDDGQHNMTHAITTTMMMLPGALLASSWLVDSDVLSIVATEIYRLVGELTERQTQSITALQCRRDRTRTLQTWAALWTKNRNRWARLYVRSSLVLHFDSCCCIFIVSFVYFAGLNSNCRCSRRKPGSWPGQWSRTYV